MLGVARAARAESDELLEILRQKEILSPQEYERVKGSPVEPAQRQQLIDVLHKKGVLSDEETRRLESAKAPPPPAPGAATAAAAPSPQVGWDEGFFVRTADGNFSLRLNGRVASNVLFLEKDTTLDNNITIDRARLSADATFYKYFRVRVEGEFTSSSILRDAFLAVNPMPEINLQFGQFTVPFSYELILSKRYTDFVERSAVVNQSVNPRRDIGLMLYGQLARKVLLYQLAVMNGAGQNRIDNNGDKDFIGRLVVFPFVLTDIDHLRGFNVGGGATWGRQPREMTRRADGTSVSTNNSISGATETTFNFYPAVARRGYRLRGNAHIAWLDGPFSITSEYIQTNEEREDLGANGEDLPDLDTDGAYVGGTWLITGETKPYNARIRPLHSVWSGPSPGWGAWEAALRYEYFKLRHGADMPGSSQVDNRYDALVAGVNWYPNEFLRFTLNYLYSTYEDQGPNRSPNPNKHSNNAVLGRAQLEF